MHQTYRASIDGARGAALCLVDRLAILQQILGFLRSKKGNELRESLLLLERITRA